MLGFIFQNKVVCCSIVTLTYMSLFFVSVGASGWLLSALRYWSEPMLGRGSSTDSVELPLSYVVRALNDFYSRKSRIQRGLLHIKYRLRGFGSSFFLSILFSLK